VPDDDWWFARAAMLEDLAPGFAERFPMVAWIERDSASRPPDDATPYLEQEAKQHFDTGLTVVLDGIEAAITRARI